MDPTDTSQLVNWLYLDMNSFYASVEQEMAPYLRGRPVAVVPLAADTTCCIAVSYEGKAFGVKTGTAVRDARQLCPAMKFIVGDHRDYIRYHNKIVEAVESCVPVEAVCSIDEIACRLTGSQRAPEIAGALAAGIKARIKATVGSSLRCSIGVGPNRFLAKMASDMQKPDGFTAIRPCDLPHILHKKVLMKLTAKAALRLRKEGFYASALHLFVGFMDRGAWKARCGLLETQDTGVFINAVQTLLKQLPEGGILSAGVVLSGLVEEESRPPALFDDPRKNQLIKILDRLNVKYGKDVIHCGATHGTENIAPLRISFTNIPDPSEV